MIFATKRIFCNFVLAPQPQPYWGQPDGLADLLVLINSVGPHHGVPPRIGLFAARYFAKLKSCELCSDLSDLYAKPRWACHPELLQIDQNSSIHTLLLLCRVGHFEFACFYSSSFEIASYLGEGNGLWLIGTENCQSTFASSKSFPFRLHLTASFQ